MDQWQNIKHVVVVGLGVTGISVVNYLQKYQPQVQIKVIDTRSRPDNLAKLADNILIHLGSFNKEWLLQADLIIVNPGISLAIAEIAQAINNGIKVVGDVEIFAWEIAQRKQKIGKDISVIAITGSNGKTTVTDLCATLAQNLGAQVAMGGNIGIPVLDLLQQPNIDLYVLELSSFQLETTDSLQLQAAAFLNLAEDHMDRYDSMHSYHQAKLRIFKHATYAVYNRDDKATQPLTADQKNNLELTFGSDPKEFGLINEHEITYLAYDQYKILRADQLKLLGRHNWLNILAVWALLKAVNLPYQNALDALKNYTPLAHRFQLVADRYGVQWINDSKATNVASTIAALSGLKCDGKLYLLLGGDGKGADFSPLKEILQFFDLQLCCFGKDAIKLTELHYGSLSFSTLQNAFEHIAPKVTNGDIVLLSPACASLDQFTNFMARGDAFINMVRNYVN